MCIKEPGMREGELVNKGVFGKNADNYSEIGREIYKMQKKYKV